MLQRGRAVSAVETVSAGAVGKTRGSLGGAEAPQDTQTEQEETGKGKDVLIADETPNGHAAPTPPHQAPSQALPTLPVGLLAVGDVHGDGLRAGAHKGVLASAAGGRVQKRPRRHFRPRGEGFRLSRARRGERGFLVSRSRWWPRRRLFGDNKKNKCRRRRGSSRGSGRPVLRRRVVVSCRRGLSDVARRGDSRGRMPG